MTAELSSPRSSLALRALWRALVRFEPEKILREVAVRNTIGFTVALILGAIFSSPSTGVVAGLGALNVAYSDSRDPYLFRARRMFISALLSGLAVMLGALSGHNGVAAVFAATLWAFAAGMLVALGSGAADLGVITLVTLVVFAAKPLPPSEALGAGMVATAGGFLQLLLSTFLWPVRRYEPERRIIAGMYSALARIAAAPPRAALSPPMTQQISYAQEALAPLSRDHSVEAERQMFLLTEAERIRLSVLNLGRLQRRIARHEGGEGDEGAALLIGRFLESASAAISGVGGCVLAGESPDRKCVSTAQLTAVLAEIRGKPLPANDAFFAALLRDARQQCDALRSQVAAAAGAASGTRKDPYPANVGAADSANSSSDWRLKFQGWRARLAANLSFDSTVFRHALRLAICLGLGDAIGHSLSLQRTYWIPMTIAIVLKPDFTSTFSRGVLRVAGTLVGLVLATVMFHVVHTGVVTDIALLAVFILFMRWFGAANYGLFVIAISAIIVLLAAVTGVSPASVILPRAINTAIGGFLALLSYAIWPTWERSQTRNALANMLDSYRGYLHAVATAYQDGDLSVIDKVRVKGRRARSNAEASVDRMSGEPGVTPGHVAALSVILVQSHSFVHAVMAMESRLYRNRRETAPLWLPALAASAERSLSVMASALRNPTGPAARPLKVGDIEVPPAVGGVSTLLEVEADRIRTSLRGLSEEIAKRGWL